MNAHAHSRTLLQSLGRAKTVAGTTVGQRVYLVRLACGDGVRKAEPMREFAERLSDEGRPFYASRISDIENDNSQPTLEEVDRIAAVDPLNRGRDWLGWGAGETDGQSGYTTPRQIPKLPFHRDQEQAPKRRKGKAS